LIYKELTLKWVDLEKEAYIWKMCLYVLKVTLKVTSVHSDAKGAICIFSGLYR